MKKTNIFKIAMTLVMAFMITGAFAQTYPTPINHTEDAINYVETVETITQTTGYGLTLYAAPDPVFSPAYDGTGARGANLNASSNWRWVYDATGYAEGGTETEVKAWANENWVEIAAGQLPAAGASRTYYVKEKTSCEAADATAQSKTVSVIAAPDATMVAANTGAAWTEITANTVYSICGEAVTDNLTLSFTELNNLYPTYVWNITATAIRYNADGDPVDAAGAVIVDPGDASAATGVTNVVDIATVVVADFDATPWAPVTPSMLYLETAGGVDLRTKYVYTLTGISSRTLALSQKRAGVATAFVAPAVSQTVTYWLNLPPVTGPIYHIPNAYSW